MIRYGEQDNLDIVTFPVWPLGCNCSIITSKASHEAIVVDPGGDADKICEILSAGKLNVKAIIHTHAHFDHCLGTHVVADFVRSSSQSDSVPVGMHPGDFGLYRMLPAQCGWFGVEPQEGEEKISLHLDDEMEIVFGDHKLKVLYTPGHTQGSCSFSIESAGIVFSGDTLFAGGIGRTDLPGGDGNLILKSIKNRLLSLDDGTAVIPGHGNFTRIYDEKKMNPFL